MRFVGYEKRVCEIFFFYLFLLKIFLIAVLLLLLKEMNGDL